MIFFDYVYSFFVLFFCEVAAFYYVVRCIYKSLTPNLISNKSYIHFYEIVLILIIPIYDSFGNIFFRPGLIPETIIVIYITKIIYFIHLLLIVFYIKKYFIEPWYHFFIISIINFNIILIPTIIFHEKQLTEELITVSINDIPLLLITIILSILLGELLCYINGKINFKKFRIVPDKLFLVISYITLFLPITVSKKISFYETQERDLFENNHNYEELSLLFLAIILIIFVNYIFNRFKEIKRENRFLEEKNEIQYKNIIENQKQEVKLNQMYHDLGNHIKTMQLLMTNHEYDEVMNYMKNLSDRFHEIAIKKYCNHPIINSVVSDKVQFCLENEIEYEVDISIYDTLKISEIDLMSIYSNLLDNAVESCMQNVHDKPYIKIKSSIINGFLIIKIENSNTNQKENKLKLNSKLKKKYKLQGVGLKIINDIVKRYEGDKQIVVDDEKYQAIVTLKNS